MRIPPAGIAAVGFLLLAFMATRGVGNEYFFYAGFTVLQFVILATAWNVLGGYCGYVNFGSSAFFALGAYAAILVFKAFDAPILVQVCAAALAGGILGLAVGYLTLRLHGIYFAIATIAVAVVLETCVLHWDYVGGARGITLMRPDSIAGFSSYNRFLFFLMAALAVAALGAARYVHASWIGRGLQAIRDNEGAAESMGVPTLRLKLIAATISGALMALAGSAQPFFLGYVEPSLAFNLNYAVMALAMPVVGGTSHWIGPLIGALLLGIMQQVATVTISSEINVLIVGLLLIIFVVAAPHGILGLMQRRWPRLAGASA